MCCAATPRWLTKPLVILGFKMGSAVHMFGPAGTGKSQLCLSMEKIYQAAYATICNENHLFDKHASASWVMCLFINVNECTFGGNVKLNNQLKALVTEKTMMVEEKFCATKSVVSHSNFITTSNEARGLKLQHGDRRFAIITTSSQYTGPSNKDFWAKVAEAVEHPAFGQELFRFLTNHAEEADIRAWNERVLPSDMPGKVALQLRYRPKNFAFLQELCMDETNVYGLKLKREVCTMRILPQDLHVAYLIFADKARLKESERLSLCDLRGLLGDYLPEHLLWARSSYPVKGKSVNAWKMPPLKDWEEWLQKNGWWDDQQLLL